MTITVYTRPNCQPCRATKRLLDKRKAKYREVDVTTSPGDLAAIKALGYQSAPVVVVSTGEPGKDVHWSGYQPHRITEHTA